MAKQADGRQTGEVAYETPWKFVERVAKRLGTTAFDWDLAATDRTAKAPFWFGPGSKYVEDALVTDGVGWAWYLSDREPFPFWCWLNPPYGRRIGEWTSRAKLLARHNIGSTVVALLPGNARDSAWWHDDCLRSHEIIDIRGRIAFEVDGVPQRNSAINNVIVIWRPGEPPCMPTLGRPMNARGE